MLLAQFCPSLLFLFEGDYAPLMPPPEVPGFDVAGTIVGVGSGAAHFKLGDEIWGDISPRAGAYAQFVVADATNIDFKPKNINFQEAAAIPLAGLTAYQALIKLGQLKTGQKVLILGGASGVGHFAIQIAKAVGFVAALHGWLLLFAAKKVMLF
jgi:NADPH:quinone reductase-like Zn-dependent oxidoreductase